METWEHEKAFEKVGRAVKYLYRAIFFLPLIIIWNYYGVLVFVFNKNENDIKPGKKTKKVLSKMIKLSEIDN